MVTNYGQREVGGITHGHTCGKARRHVIGTCIATYEQRLMCNLNYLTLIYQRDLLSLSLSLWSLDDLSQRTSTRYSTCSDFIYSQTTLSNEEVIRSFSCLYKSQDSLVSHFCFVNNATPTFY